jgi:hypothetical protein
MECVVCAAPLEGRRTRFCSRPCASKQHRREATERGAAWVRSETYRKPVTLICAECGCDFSGIDWGKDADHRYRYCSVECEAAAKSARYRGKWIGQGRVSACPHGTGNVATCIACNFVTRAGRRTAEFKRVLRCDPCAYCGEAGGALDHIQPKNAGGVDGWTNLTSSCRSCNSLKTDLRLLEALLWVPVAREYHRQRRILFGA